MTPIAVVVLVSLGRPTVYPVPEDARAKAIELWKKEHDAHREKAEGEVKSLRNATGNAGLAKKATAEKALKRMGSEPFYTPAMRLIGDGDTTGKVGCLKAADVKVIAEVPGGWVGEVEFMSSGELVTGFNRPSVGLIQKQYLFLTPFPGRSKIGKTTEQTGFFYSVGEITLKSGQVIRTLAPVRIDPADMPNPPKK